MSYKACTSPTLAAEIEQLRQNTLLLNSSCLGGAFGFGDAYQDLRSSVCSSLQVHLSRSSKAAVKQQ
jgi:hypothetical protein